QKRQDTDRWVEVCRNSISWKKDADLSKEIMCDWFPAGDVEMFRASKYVLFFDETAVAPRIKCRTGRKAIDVRFDKLEATEQQMLGLFLCVFRRTSERHLSYVTIAR